MSLNESATTARAAARAEALFRDGYSCSQAVAFAFAEQLGIDPDIVLRAACGFGGGIGRRQETCGAVTGGVIALGLRHGRGQGEPKAKSDTTYALVEAFMRRFESVHHTCRCRDLLGGCNFNTKEGEATFKARGYREARCEVFIRDAVRIVSELMRATPPA